MHCMSVTYLLSATTLQSASGPSLEYTPAFPDLCPQYARFQILKSGKDSFYWACCICALLLGETLTRKPGLPSHLSDSIALTSVHTEREIAQVLAVESCNPSTLLVASAG
mmetsp:Transcript_80325/g.141758  ORF Transcript_80325/g.141758 Transcript_80325/m.141758 type:complete len:110 (-) Transcript_80325:3831-4160(-)